MTELEKLKKTFSKFRAKEKSKRIPKRLKAKVVKLTKEGHSFESIAAS